MNNKQKINLLQTSYEDLLNNEEALKAEVEKLKNPEYIERYAKEKFLYTKENEIIIRKTDTNNWYLLFLRRSIFKKFFNTNT